MNSQSVRPQDVDMMELAQSGCRVNNVGSPERAVCDALCLALQDLQQLSQAIVEALAAWDTTVLPKYSDGMMQDRMECLRATLANALRPV